MSICGGGISEKTEEDSDVLEPWRFLVKLRWGWFRLGGKWVCSTFVLTVYVVSTLIRESFLFLAWRCGGAWMFLKDADESGWFWP